MDRNRTPNAQASSTVESLAVLIRNNAPEGKFKLLNLSFIFFQRYKITELYQPPPNMPRSAGRHSAQRLRRRKTEHSSESANYEAEFGADAPPGGQTRPERARFENGSRGASEADA